MPLSTTFLADTTRLNLSFSKCQERLLWGRLICRYVYMYVCTYIYIYIYMYMYIYKHTYTVYVMTLFTWELHTTFSAYCFRLSRFLQCCNPCDCIKKNIHTLINVLFVPMQSCRRTNTSAWYVYIYICICIYMHTYTYTHIHTYIYIYIYMYIHTHIHIHTYTYIHVYIHIHTHT
jgi:hypothetical protein